MDSQFLVSLLRTWAPILLLVALWLFFMRRLRPFSQQQARHLERQVELLERIAVALERRR